MKEYIEREAVLKHLDECRGTPSEMCYSYPIFTALKCFVEDIPAADVTEVRHASWERVIPTKSAAKWSTKVSCSQCHGQGYERYNYCPNCGAYMMGESNGKCE